jgi:hypothetical protein
MPELNPHPIMVEQAKKLLREHDMVTVIAHLLEEIDLLQAAVRAMNTRGEKLH